MTPEQALETVNAHLHIGARVTFDWKTVKCQVLDEDDGGSHKTYLDATECGHIAKAFECLAAALAPGPVPKEKT